MKRRVLLPNRERAFVRPAEVVFDYPAARRQRKAALGRRQLDESQADAMRLSVRARLIAGLALVHEGGFDRVPGRLLDPFGQRTNLRPVLLVGGSDQDRQHLT